MHLASSRASSPWQHWRPRSGARRLRSRRIGATGTRSRHAKSVVTPHAATASPIPMSCSNSLRRPTRTGSSRRRGRGASTSISAMMRAGRELSTMTRSARNSASSTSWVTNSAVKRAFLPQLQELGLHGEACQRVELAERLVEDKEPWLVDEGAGERHALSHAARELMRIGVSESGEPDPLELLVDAMRLSLDQPLRLETKRHIRAYAAPGEERRVLKDDDA